MSILVTDWFKNHFDSINWAVPKQVGVKVYSRCPQLGTEYAEVFKNVAGLDDMNDYPEWAPVRAIVSATSTLYLEEIATPLGAALQLVYSSGSTADVDDPLEADRRGWIFEEPSLNAGVQDQISAAVWYLVGTYSGVTNPVMFATNQGIGTYTIAHSGAMYGQYSSGIAAGEQYVVRVDSTGSRVDVFEGNTILLPADPIWESAHAHHLWLEPQRTNFAVNPSFENGQVNGWRLSSSASISAVAGGVSSFCGEISPGGVPPVLESNLFPVTGEWLSIRFSVRSDSAATLTFGVVTFDSTYTVKSFITADPVTLSEEPRSVSEASVLSSAGFVTVRALVRIPAGAVEACLRIESDGDGVLWIDNVLLDPHEGQYEYFDGDSETGLTGDYRWMGGVASEHFSLWYNNYLNTRYRLMGDYDTNDNLYKPGLVEEWAPTGANIIGHWDAVTSFTPLNWVGDAFYPVSEVQGTPVTTIT